MFAFEERESKVDNIELIRTITIIIYYVSFVFYLPMLFLIFKGFITKCFSQIGICSMKLVDDEIEGMGFAIPIEYAMNHAESLENNKKIEWPVLGISMVNVTDTATLRQYNISVDKDITYGAVVLEAVKDSGAEKAGLKKGDVIIKVNDTKIKDHAYLRYELYQHQAGDTINVTYIRDGKEHTTKVTLTKS